MSRTPVSQLFGNLKHAAIYSKYRPRTTTSVIQRIIQYLGEEINSPYENALDVGCGSGQSTKILGSYFKSVIGLDVSEAQIQEAQKNTEPNITYSVSPSEKLSVATNSIQLITGSQCHHWFDLPVFFEEARRVLVPNGVMCFYFYAMPQPVVANDEEKTKKLQKLVETTYRVDTIEYWDERRKVVDKGFEGLPIFPFRNVVRENILLENDITLADYLGYITSWSAFQKMLNEDEGKANLLIKNLESSMLNEMNCQLSADQIPIKSSLKYYIVMGRK